MLKRLAFLFFALPPFLSLGLTRGLPDELAQALGNNVEALTPCRTFQTPQGSLYVIEKLKITLSDEKIPTASRTFDLTCYRLQNGTPSFQTWLGEAGAPLRAVLRRHGIPLPGHFAFSGEHLAEEEIPPPENLARDWSGRFDPENWRHWNTIADLYAQTDAAAHAFYALNQAYMRTPRQLKKPATDAYLKSLPYPNSQAALLFTRLLRMHFASSYRFQSTLYTPEMIAFERGYHRGILGFRKEAYRLLPFTQATYTPEAIPETGHDLIAVNWMTKFFMRTELSPDLTGKCSIYQPNEEGRFQKTDEWTISGTSTLNAIPSTIRQLAAYQTFATEYSITPQTPVWIFNDLNTVLLYPLPENPRHAVAVVFHSENSDFSVWPFFDLRYIPTDKAEATSPNN